MEARGGGMGEGIWTLETVASQRFTVKKFNNP